MLIVSRDRRIRTFDLAAPNGALYQTELHPDDASTNSCMKVPDLRISYTERKYIRDDRMRFGSSRHPEYATSSYRALRSYHSSFSIASVIGHLVDTDGVRTHDPLLAKQMFYQLNYWPIRSFRFFNMQIRFSTGSFVDDQNILKRSGVVNPSASKNLIFLMEVI